MTKRQAKRLEKLLAGVKPFGVTITTTTEDPDEPGRLLFSDNVENRHDDGDPAKLERYVLVAYDDPRFDAIAVFSFGKLAQLKREIQHYSTDTFIVAFDLDGNRAYSAEWETRVKLVRPAA